jgi:SGNH domain (fused to AT3 domains)
MLPTRAWELALGAALAFAPAIRKARLAEAANIAGLLLIGCGIVFLTEDSAFPGYNALYPCLGAALVVWPKRSATLSGQLLAWRPMVLIGLISYSLYLWHWPVITYFRIYNIGHDIGEFEGTLLLSISFLLAFASWKYIEMPFRQWRAPDWRIISAGLSTIGICVLIGIGLHGANGAPWRLSDEERKIAQYMGYKSGFGKEICRLEGDDIKLSCPAHNERQPNVLLMGDSHAIHFARALPITFPNVNFFIAARSGCRPVIDAVASDGKDECVELMDWVFHEAVPNMWFDSIILSARWRNGHSEQLPATVAYLRKYTDRVIVFGQTMEYRTSLPEMMLVDALPREESNLNRKDRFDEVSRLNMQIISALRSTGAEVFLPSEAICPAGRCSSQTPTGALYQFDKAHLTLDGATEVLSRFKRLGLSFGQEPNRAASVSMIKR